MFTSSPDSTSEPSNNYNGTGLNRDLIIHPRILENYAARLQQVWVPWYDIHIVKSPLESVLPGIAIMRHKS